MDLSTVIALATFVVMLVVNLISAGIFIGGLFFSIKFIEKQIKVLEEKQDKHNCLIERMAIVEQSDKAAHHRIDELREEVRIEQNT